VQTIAELKDQADRALFEQRYAQALQLYAAMVALQPGNLDARLRVADALLALGEPQSAAVVYTALARHAALSGYPLRALVALKILWTLEPKLGVLLTEVARLYARDSPRIGRSVRRALPELSERVEHRMPDDTAPADQALFTHAEQLAARYQPDALFYPEKLLPIPVLSLLPEAEFAGALEALRLVRVRPDTWIVRQGEPGHSFFVLARGTVEVSLQRDHQVLVLAQLSEGSIFGEMVLLSDAPRSASVRARSDCDLLEFDCDLLGAAGSTLKHLTAALKGFAHERLLGNVAATSALFRPLDAKQRTDLVRRFVSVEVAPLKPIIREREPGTGLYVVLRGDVLVTRATAEGAQNVATLGAAEAFGEIALLTRELTSATVAAGTRGATLLFLHRDYFERLIAAVPELRVYFEHLSETRLMDMRLLGAEPAAVGDELEIDVLI
jgi:CRP-like cAMP-binding protein